MTTENTDPTTLPALTLSVTLAGLPPGLDVRVVDAIAAQPADPGNRRRKPTPATPPCLIIEVTGIVVHPGDVVPVLLFDDGEVDTVGFTPDAMTRLDRLIPAGAEEVGPYYGQTVTGAIDAGYFYPDGGVATIRIAVPLTGMVAT